MSNTQKNPDFLFYILGGGNASNGNWRGGAGAGNQTKMTFMISSSDVGRLIGSGGSRIKELRQASGCRVGIFLKLCILYQAYSIRRWDKQIRFRLLMLEDPSVVVGPESKK